MGESEDDGMASIPTGEEYSPCRFNTATGEEKNMNFHTRLNRVASVGEIISLMMPGTFHPAGASGSAPRREIPADWKTPASSASSKLPTQTFHPNSNATFHRSNSHRPPLAGSSLRQQ